MCKIFKNFLVREKSFVLVLKWLTVGWSLACTANSILASDLVNVGFSVGVTELGPACNDYYYTYEAYKVQFGNTTQGSVPQPPYSSSSCYCPAYMYGFSSKLEAGGTYQWTLTLPSNPAFCGSPDYSTVSFSVIDACASATIYINGVATNNFVFPTSELVGNAIISCDVSVVMQQILFQWDYPSDGSQSLRADGVSIISGTATNISPNVTWSITGQDLGCKLLLTNGPTVIVQAGTNIGTINISAIDPVSGTCSTQPLKLIDACSNGGCSACQAGGGLSVANNCLAMKLNLGWALEGNTADYLQVKAYTPSATIATPAGLHYDFQHTDVEVYTNANGLCQIKAPQMFVNIITNSSSKYSIQLYNLTNVLSDPVNSGGYYALANSPYRTISVENPGGNTNEVVIADSNDSATYDFIWQTNDWLLVSGGGLRSELKSTITTNALVITTTTIATGSNTPVQTKIETWQGYSTNGQRLVQEIFGSGAAARTNNYSYNSNGFLQEVIRADGSWEFYLYDNYNRPTNIFSGFLNQGVTTNRALCRLTVNDYSTNQIPGSGDTGIPFFLTPRCSIQYVGGQEVSRKFFICLIGQKREIQCVAPGAAWNDTNNLVTTYNLFRNGYRINEPWQIIHPDGTADIYAYDGIAGANLANTLWSGHLDSTGTNIDDGTETVTIVGPTRLLISKMIMDIKSGIMTSEENYAYDSLNRLTATTYLDGTYIQNIYDCCTISSQQGRSGTITSYTYDALKRLLTTTLDGVTTSNVYDPAGNVLSVVRYGTDGSAITISQASYDNAGQQTSATDALSNTSIYTNYFDGSGQFVKQTTNPDSSTRIETYYQDGSSQSVTGTAVSPVRYIYGVESDGGILRAYAKAIQLDAGGADTGDWTKTYRNGAGQVYKTVYADNNFSHSLYNSLGQLVSQTDPDGVTTLYQYDDQGRQSYVASDLNTNGVIDFNGTDRISETVNDVISDNGVVVNRTRNFIWETNGVGISNLVSETETSVDGLQSWNIVFNNGTGVTNHSQTSYDSIHGYCITMLTAPDGSMTFTTNQYGRIISTTKKYSFGIPINQTVYGYDAQGRQNTVTGARNGTTTLYFNNVDQIVGTLTPSPDGVQSGQLTTNILDSMGRVVTIIQPDGTSVTNQYYFNGLLHKIYGSRTYPVQYTYDAQGRMLTMTTWTNFAASSGAAVTMWNYDGYRGFLTNKVYADGKGPLYAYTAAGRLNTRTWARGITTTYSYDHAGGLSMVNYSDSTSALVYGYDRMGRQVAVTNGATVCNLAYNEPGQLIGESYTSGPLNGFSVTNGYDRILRRTALSLVNSSSSVMAASTYGYDYISRLSTVSDGTNTANYSYVANSSLVGSIAFQRNGQTLMTTTKTYDFLNRLTAIQSSAGFTPFTSFAYNYNSANQRTAMTNADNSHWVYQYDSLGQVISGKKYWADGTPVAGQQFTYNFDDIGNRKTTASGGDASGANLRSANYTANNLNQITSRDVPGYIETLGSANPNATVTVNLQRAYRYGGYFQDELSANNTGSALWFSLTNLAVLNNGTNADITATNTGNVFVPLTPEVFKYDADGNLTNDGRWAYTWDGENRLKQMTVNTNVGPQYQLTFGYDAKGRRIQKLVATNGVALFTNKFLYDGWNLIAETRPDNSLIRSYVWGTDLSGTSQGAGGVGGLLEISYYGSSTTNCFPAYDGNGNIIALVNAVDETVAANYEYAAFGEPIRITGVMAKNNPFRFSTKYADDESDLLYYGYRYYKPSTGTWPNKDPMQEKGGLNLYGAIGNDEVNKSDYLGLVSAWDLSMFGKWLFDPFANNEIVILSWNTFDSDGSARQALAREWLANNIGIFKQKCKAAPIGSSIIPYSDLKAVFNQLEYNDVNKWISFWLGNAQVSPLSKGVSLDKDCKECVFNYHLLLEANDKSDFNPGDHFGNLGFLTSDDTYIWIKNHTPFGHDYYLYGSTDEEGEWDYKYGK